MPDQSNREQEIFGALELAGPRERAGYLDSACGSDAVLRACVESLLRAYDEAGGFLPETAESPTKLKFIHSRTLAVHQRATSACRTTGIPSSFGTSKFA